MVLGEKLTVPVAGRPPMAWGSDAIAELLSRMDLRYISLTPGASYRGLHDSLVNYLGNTKPEMILCLHEEHAVAVAHGYAKVTGTPMAVALHANVGLMHGTMAIFNAFCDRAPMVIVGATGPLDASQRRPWIDWIHTAADQGALVRPYTKWDDQPGSVPAALESLLHADRLARSYPTAPTYVCLDAALQESPLHEPLTMPSLKRHMPPLPPAAPAAAVAQVAHLLRSAHRPLILMGRMGRLETQWDARVHLAERLGACVVTDLKVGAVFPTQHRLHPAAPHTRLSADARALVSQADVVCALDWIDLGGTMAGIVPERPPQQLIEVSGDSALHNGWSKDHFCLPECDISIASDPNQFVDALLEHLDGVGATAPSTVDRDWPGLVTHADLRADAGIAGDEDGLAMSTATRVLHEMLADRTYCYTALPRGWDTDILDFTGPLSYLGRDGGGGVGAGPGLAVGAALGLAGSGRLPVAVIGDGDYMMGATALWSAAHHRLATLVVVANNRSYYNDEIHQQRMADQRGRPGENRWVGQHLRDPDPDIAGLARSLGLTGYGPVSEPASLSKAIAAALEDVAAGRSAVIDVHVTPSANQASAPSGEPGR